MQRADREARLERAKAIGRIAYSHVRWADIEANLPIDGKEKQLRELIEQHRDRPGRTFPPARSSRRVFAKVFEVRWDKAGGFKVVHYDQGDWERTLRAWPAPIPFE
jgi:hypothetical protein